MGFPSGFNFRSTLAFVTDVFADVFVGTSGSYPTTFSNGVTAGYESGTGSIQARNRSAANPVRLAGRHWVNLAVDMPWRVDLSTNGSWNIQLATGDFTYTNVAAIDIKDTNVVLTTISGTTSATNHFFDATGADLTAANWNLGTNGRGGVYVGAFSTTILRAVAKGATSLTTGLTHLYIEATVPPAGYITGTCPGIIGP